MAKNISNHHRVDTEPSAPEEFFILGSQDRGSPLEKCVLCGMPITTQKWAIRSYSGTETYPQWIWRHMKYVFTFGWAKYIPFYLPVCEKCVGRLSHDKFYKQVSR